MRRECAASVPAPVSAASASASWQRAALSCLPAYGIDGRHLPLFPRTKVRDACSHWTEGLIHLLLLLPTNSSTSFKLVPDFLLKNKAK